MKRLPLLALLSLCSLPLLVACPGEPPEEGKDGGVRDAGVEDAGVEDAGAVDGGVEDAGSADAGDTDAGDADAGAVDGGVADAGDTDAGIADGGVADAGVIDAGQEECGPGYRPDGSNGCELNEPALDDPDLALWLDASDATTLTLDSGNVFDWQDRRQIGALDKLTGASAGVRPAFIADGWNGRGVVEFADGDHLTSSGFDDLSGELNYTIFVVASNTTGGDRGIITLTNGGNPGVRLGFTGGGSTLSFLHRVPYGATGGVNVTLDNVAANVPHILWGRRAGGVINPELTVGASYPVNLTGASQTNNATTNNWDGQGTVNLGGAAGTGFEGRVAEILIFTRYFNDAALAEMREYLNAKWGVLVPN